MTIFGQCHNVLNNKSVYWTCLLKTVNVATGKGRDLSLYDGKIRKLDCQYPHSSVCVCGVLPKRTASPH